MMPCATRVGGSRFQNKAPHNWKKADSLCSFLQSRVLKYALGVGSLDKRGKKREMIFYSGISNMKFVMRNVTENTRET